MHESQDVSCRNTQRPKRKKHKAVSASWSQVCQQTGIRFARMP